MLPHKPLLYVSASALLLSVGYFCPFCAAPLIYFFMIPIFYIALSASEKLSFKEGVIWGAIFFGLHFYGIFYLIYEHGQGRLKALAAVVLWLNGVVHAGFWFWFATWLSRRKSEYLFWRLSCWMVTTMLFFYWLKHWM